MRTLYYVVIFVMLVGCKADMICPAYQSYFLLDEETQKSQFAYFALDSLPRRDIFNSSKDKNGLVAKSSLLSYVNTDWVREREIRTIDMEVIYPQASDSILFAGDAMMYAETDVIDSAALDSARFAAQTFKYGADQKYYNWYFRNKLVWKDELNKKEEPANLSNPNQVIEDPLKEPAEKKGLKGLFKKKEKQPKEPKEKKAKSKKERKKETPILENTPVVPVNEEEDNGEDDF